MTVMSEQAADVSEVPGFIKHFAKAKDCFLDGCCYWFGYILQARFGARLFYLYEEGHFISQIHGRFYDVTGDVTEQYGQRPMLAWDEMEQFDSGRYGRIVRDCVLKLPDEDE